MFMKQHKIAIKKFFVYIIKFSYKCNFVFLLFDFGLKCDPYKFLTDFMILTNYCKTNTASLNKMSIKGRGLYDIWAAWVYIHNECYKLFLYSFSTCTPTFQHKNSMGIAYALHEFIFTSHFYCCNLKHSRAFIAAFSITAPDPAETLLTKLS